jgi:hypothetical protein
MSEILPLAVFSLDRRKGIDLGHDDDTDDEQEQWTFDGPTIIRQLCEGVNRDDISEACRDAELLPHATRFVMFGRWVGSYDAWNGEHDAWLEDVSIVALTMRKEDDASFR